jgi:hypothetical protein
VFPLTDAPARVADRLIELASVSDVVCELLTLCRQRMAARSFRPTPFFLPWVILFSYLLKGYKSIPKSTKS